MRKRRVSFDRGHGTGVDDAATAFLHVGDHRAGAEEDALHVDVHVEVPFLLGQVPKRSHAGDAGIVADDVQRAVLRLNGLEDALDLPIVRDVHFHGHVGRIFFVACEKRQRFLKRGFVDVGGYDDRAHPGQPFRDRDAGSRRMA